VPDVRPHHQTVRRCPIWDPPLHLLSHWVLGAMAVGGAEETRSAVVRSLETTARDDHQGGGQSLPGSAWESENHSEGR
jgi:hypothetical protein